MLLFGVRVIIRGKSTVSVVRHCDIYATVCRGVGCVARYPHVIFHLKMLEVVSAPV